MEEAVDGPRTRRKRATLVAEKEESESADAL